MYDLEHYTTCPVCDCRRYWVLAPREQLEYEKEFRNRLFRRNLPNVSESMLDDLTVFTNAYPARLVVCQDCGVICRDPRFSPQGSIHAYSSDDYSEEWLETTFGEYYDSYSRKMSELKRVVGEQASVLEVGSYVGGFLAAARDAGWHAQGVDVGRRVSEFCRGKGLDVLTGTLREANLKSSDYDAVFIWVCFDQLPNPRQELEEIRRVLKPGGWLFIHVPNGDYIKWMQKILRWGFRTRICKALAYSGMAGFPYQLGYDGPGLANLLLRLGFSNIRIKNQMDVCDGSARTGMQVPEQTRYLRRIRAVSEFIYRASGNRLVKGPWLLATCRRTLENKSGQCVENARAS